jgi:SPP1 gp7 family putative phage head morphogenesis protein
VANNDDYLDSIIESILKGIHNGEFGSGHIHKKLFNRTLKLFKESLKSYGEDQWTVDYATPDYNTITALKNNLSAFSAAKTYSQIKAMNELLLDENGNMRSYQDFRDLALQVHKDYNRNWLNTEYNTAIGNAQMAARWNDIQANESATHITVYTAGDERVRDEHVGYDGFTRPKSDPVWRSFWPPFDWACRCYAIEGIDLDSSEIDPGMDKIPPLFRNNPGTSGVIFKSQHPYFQDLDGSVAELEAVKNYGFKSMTQIYADVSKLPTFEQNSKQAIWESMRALYPSGTDKVLFAAKDGYKSELSKKVFDAVLMASEIHPIIDSKSEQWLGSNGQITYLKFYKTLVYMVRVSKTGKVTDMGSLQPNDVEQYRKGIPI